MAEKKNPLKSRTLWIAFIQGALQLANLFVPGVSEVLTPVVMGVIGLASASVQAYTRFKTEKPLDKIENPKKIAKKLLGKLNL